MFEKGVEILVFLIDRRGVKCLLSSTLLSRVALIQLGKGSIGSRKGGMVNGKQLRIQEDIIYVKDSCHKVPIRLNTSNVEVE